MGEKTGNARIIDSIWMAVSVDPEDNLEGVCAVFVPGMGHVPLIAGDERRLPWVMENARIVAVQRNLKVKIIKLLTREVVEEIDPAIPVQ